MKEQPERVNLEDKTAEEIAEILASVKFGIIDRRNQAIGELTVLKAKEEQE